MRETAHTLYDPIVVSNFFLPPSSVHLVFNSLSGEMCKCDFVLISRRYSNAREGAPRRASRIYAICTIIISDNYLVFHEPHALSVLKARTELYARRGVRGILSHMVCSYQLLLRIVRQDVAIVTPLLPSCFISRRGCFVHSSLFPQQWWEIWIAILIQPAPNRKASVQGYFACISWARAYRCVARGCWCCIIESMFSIPFVGGEGQGEIFI